jgi:uncharacterized membrane protein YecN with MAPEG domain
MEYVALVTGLAVLEYLVISFYVGWARGKFQVAAPATTGHPEFERYFRVQQNTVEQLVLFVPSLWLFGYFMGGALAAVIGCVFLLGRILYFRGYVRDPEKRGLGFAIGLIANVVLLIGGIAGAVIAVV